MLASIRKCKKCTRLFESPGTRHRVCAQCRSVPKRYDGERPREYFPDLTEAQIDQVFRERLAEVRRQRLYSIEDAGGLGRDYRRSYED